MTLYLRTVDKDRKSYNGFKWPRKIGSIVKAPDWQPAALCGNGLHGLPWGQGDLSLLNLHADSVFQVVEYTGSAAIDLGGKHKFPECTLLFEGARDKAAALLAAAAPRNLAIPFLIATADDDGTAMAGPYGTAMAGPYGTATAGDNGTARAGSYGTATAGYGGTATAGDNGTATAGIRGTATAGACGTLMLKFFDGSRYRHAIAYAGENGIEADKPYKLNSAHAFIPA